MACLYGRGRGGGCPLCGGGGCPCWGVWCFGGGGFGVWGVSCFLVVPFVVGGGAGRSPGWVILRGGLCGVLSARIAHACSMC